MPEPDLLELAAIAIANRSIEPSCVWNICIVAGKIQCLKTKEIPMATRILYRFPDMAAKKGLNSKQWNELENNIRLYMKGNPECLNRQKP